MSQGATPSVVNGTPRSPRSEPRDDGGLPVARTSGAGASGLLLAFALICLVGVVLSLELTRIHLLVHTDPSYHSVCAVNEGVNCETVASSPYSVFAWLPVSVWGLAAYLVMAVLGLWGFSRRRLHRAWPLGLLLLLSTTAVGASAILAYVSATRIDSLCLFCMGSYGVNLALFTIVLLAWRRTRGQLRELVLADLKALDARPTLLTTLVLPSAATLGALFAFVPSYWQTPTWSDLPVMAFGTDDQGHPWIGAQDPRLTIVEFTDYECPHCRAAHKAMRMLVAEHPNQVRLIHRHLPLDMACHPGLIEPFHTRSCLFAEAAECAGLQGRFWAMNDALFSIQDTTKAEDVDPVDLAVRLGLDRSEFASCLATHATAERVTEDLREAMSRKLIGTPTFLVDERLFVGGISEAELANLLAAAR